MTPVKVAFVSSWSRSGSTLLDLLLGRLPGFWSAGEIRYLWDRGLLEDQLCGLMAGGGYEGPGRSPDRADALVWALSELMLGRRSEPRVRGL